MVRIATFVFFDTETTGLPSEENNRTKIIELSMVAVNRDHILEQADLLSSKQVIPISPRVINKLTLCLNPQKLISETASVTTGLTNDLLEYRAHFDSRVFAMLDNFLKVLPKPVCIVAYNGHGFDLPILKNHLERINAKLPDDLLCADALYGVYDLKEGDEHRRMNKITSEITNIQDELQPLISMQALNETTPIKRKLTHPKPLCGKKRKIYFEGHPKPMTSYKLLELYKETVSHGSQPNAHRAEDDCIMLLEIAVTMGLLLLTGVFWGCTNPFIRQGTKGLRDVKAKTWLGQAWAEVTFLLGNWKYVVPWMINQAGSLVYLAAVQRAPLSVAVPTANSAAFAFTALTGAAVGTEQPLDAVSIFGIACIVIGTALCCWDKTE